MNGIEKISSAKPGTLVPVHETHNLEESALAYFRRLSNRGRKKECVFLESRDVSVPRGERSFGSVRPCLTLTGRGEDFTVRARNKAGERFVDHLFPQLSFVPDTNRSRHRITGTLPPDRGQTSEASRMNARTHGDLIRSVAFLLDPLKNSLPIEPGLFGVIGYDFVDQFEELPPAGNSLSEDPDYELHFCDNLFSVNHRNDTITFITGAMIFENEDRKRERSRCRNLLDLYRSHLDTSLSDVDAGKPFNEDEVTTDCSREEFKNTVRSLKDHIKRGNVFQVVPSRTRMAPVRTRPLLVYEELRNLNPSPYMFYLSGPSGTLLGSSPETCVRVTGQGEQTIELRPIAGTRPRGMRNGDIDPDLDARIETELKTDEKERAEHTMLIDLARNDVARVSKPGTRYCDTVFSVEKYATVQHLVSNVRGILRADLDAVHAYLATMNMGTLTGAPKIQAMKLLRKHEPSRRGFYGGAVGYLTASGEMDTAIVIRSIRIRDGRAFLRAGAGVVHDSDPENEFVETEQKLDATTTALKQAHPDP